MVSDRMNRQDPNLVGELGLARKQERRELCGHQLEGDASEAKLKERTTGTEEKWGSKRREGKKLEDQNGDTRNEFIGGKKR